MAALLLTACDGTGEISRTDEPAYGGSGSSSSSGSSGSGGSYTANFSFDEFMRLSGAGDTEALTRMFRDDSVSSGSGSTEGGEYGMDELVMSADDLGVPEGGTVTLSITGGVEDYEEEVEVSDDGMLYFQVPRQRIGSEITVKLIVKKENGKVVRSGKKTMLVKAGIQFGITLKHSAPEDFVFVAGGTFTSARAELAAAGSQTIADFYICIHEVTQGEYEKYCSYGGPTPSSSGYGAGPDYPAYYVSWYDALVYCNRRSLAEGLTPYYSIGGSTNPDDWGAIPATAADWSHPARVSSADGYRLPTQWEWEYAASDGHAYSGSDTVDDVAWHRGNSGDDGGSTNRKAHPVMTKAPNAKGIYDMSGNVEEWCWEQDGITVSRVIRGGCWVSLNAASCKVSSWSSTAPYNRDLSGGLIFLGFRVVRSAD